jgi:hypothetical protein
MIDNMVAQLTAALNEEEREELVALRAENAALKEQLVRMDAALTADINAAVKTALFGRPTSTPVQALATKTVREHLTGGHAYTPASKRINDPSQD